MTIRKIVFLRSIKNFILENKQNPVFLQKNLFEIVGWVKERNPTYYYQTVESIHELPHSMLDH